MAAYKEVIEKGITLTPLEDKCIWTQTSNEMFMYATALDMVRQRNIASVVDKCCWHPNLQIKVSVFLSKLLHNAIPTNVAFMKKGITIIISKCMCCSVSPFMEYNTHLFLSLEVATKVWHVFSHYMWLTLQCFTIGHLLASWWDHCSGNSLYSWLLRMIPAAKFDNNVMGSESIIELVINYISDKYQAHKLELPQGKASTELLQPFRLKCCQATSHFTIVQWIPSMTNWVKLNCDGASKGNPELAEAGGTIRSCSGPCIHAYNSFLCLQTSVYAESITLVHGVKMVVEHHYTNLLIELDSKTG